MVLSHQLVPIHSANHGISSYNSTTSWGQHIQTRRFWETCFIPFSFSQNDFGCMNFWSTSKCEHLFVRSVSPGLGSHPRDWERSCFFLHWEGTLVSHQRLQFILLKPTTAKLSPWECPLAAPAVVRKASQMLFTRQVGVKAAATQNVKAAQLWQKWHSRQTEKLSSSFQYGVLLWLEVGTAALKQVIMEDT